MIRQELASGGGTARAQAAPADRMGEQEAELDLAELCQRAGIDASARTRARGVRTARRRGSRAASSFYREGDAEIAAACGRLAQYGIDARHLRTFRNSAGREAGLLEQLVAPALRSRNPERRKTGLDDLQSLAETSQELSRLLFWRELRLLAER